MSWIHPSLLFLGLFAIAPLALHWFFFQKPIQKQLFPTFRFLVSSRVQAVRRKKIQEWLILCLRIFLLLLFSWIVARPFQRASSVETVEKIAFLLDDSLSAGYRTHGTLAFQRMTTQALTLLEKIPPSIPIAIYFTRGDFVDFTLDRSLLQQTLLQERPLTHSYPCSPQATRILARFKHEPGELLLFTDRTQRALQDLPLSPLIKFVDCGFDSPQSSSISAIRLGETRLPKTPVTIEFRGHFLQNTQAFLKINQELVQSIHLRAPFQEYYQFEYTPPSSGIYEVEIALEDDPLLADHRRYSVFQIRESPRVLLIGEPDECFFLEKALLAVGCKIRFVPPRQLESHIVHDFDLFYLVDSPQYQDTHLNIFRGFLQQKKPFVYYPGKQGCFLGASLISKEPISSVERKSFALASHLSVLPEELLMTLSLEQFVPLILPFDSQAMVSLQDGRPLIVPLENGIWNGFSPSLINQKLVCSPVFPILQSYWLDRLLKTSLENESEIHRTPGQPYWNQHSSTKQLFQERLFLPDQQEKVLDSGKSFLDTWQLGHYRIYSEGKQQKVFCVNPEPEEFILATLSVEEIRQKQGSEAFHFRYAESAPQEREWTFFLLYLSSFLLVLETVWSNRLYRHS